MKYLLLLLLIGCKTYNYTNSFGVVCHTHKQIPQPEVEKHVDSIGVWYYVRYKNGSGFIFDTTNWTRHKQELEAPVITPKPKDCGCN